METEAAVSEKAKVVECSVERRDAIGERGIHRLF